MPRRRIAPGGLFLCLFLSMTVGGSSYAAGLDAKPGLWERSVTTQTDLSPTAKHDLSKLSPADRAKFEKMMSGQISTGRRTRISKECVTPAMLAGWSTVARDASGAKGQRT